MCVGQSAPKWCSLRVHTRPGSSLVLRSVGAVPHPCQGPSARICRSREGFVTRPRVGTPRSVGPAASSWPPIRSIPSTHGRRNCTSLLHLRTSRYELSAVQPTAERLGLSSLPGPAPGLDRAGPAGSVAPASPGAGSRDGRPGGSPPRGGLGRRSAPLAAARLGLVGFDPWVRWGRLRSAGLSARPGVVAGLLAAGPVPAHGSRGRCRPIRRGRWRCGHRPPAARSRIRT